MGADQLRKGGEPAKRDCVKALLESGFAAWCPLAHDDAHRDEFSDAGGVMAERPSSDSIMGRQTMSAIRRRSSCAHQLRNEAVFMSCAFIDDHQRSPPRVSTSCVKTCRENGAPRREHLDCAAVACSRAP